MRYVIIGNSGAAISAIKAIRTVDKQGNILLISKENCCAYSPMSTTHYISGQISYEQMFFCGGDFYQENGVETILGKKATKVHAHPKRVDLEDGNSVTYDKLLLATGSSPRVPPIPGVDLPGVFNLYTEDDARRIHDTLEEARTVAIVGAGLSGFHALNALTEKGKKVILIEAARQVLPAFLDPESAAMLDERLDQEGIALYMGEMVAEIRPKANQRVVKLGSGRQVEADVVILAVGVKPNLDLVGETGIIVNRGILVDEYCRTNLEDIFAAGDVSEGIDPLTGKRYINATWFNAVEQGRIAGMNLAGIKVPYVRNVRLNAFSLLGLQCASVGLTGAEGPEHETMTCKDSENYRKFILRGDVLVGATLIGDIRDAGLLANLIRKQQPIPNLRGELESGAAISICARSLSVLTA